ncbi:DUF4870 domain-containing protein [Flindersiella endophytica]
MSEPHHEVQPMPSETERNWALVSHIGSLLAAYIFLGLLCPLLVLLTKGKESSFVRAHAVESLNFQITAAIAGVISALLVYVLIGILLLVIVGLVYIVFLTIATLEASRGRLYHYPFSIRFVR